MPTPSEPLTLSALYIYPVKSAGGISLSTSAVGPRGLIHDRRWMVVDASGRLVTQREETRLKLVDVSLEESGLRLGAPQMPSLSVPFEPQGQLLTADLWGQMLPSVSVSPECAAWLSRYLGGQFELVYMPDETQRFQPDDRPYSSQLSFVDGSPFNLISAASLADLNAQLARPVSAADLRPNFVISGGAAYQEDFWRRIRIGAVGFEVVETCARCSVINVTKEAQMSAEPLRTLARTRRRGQDVPFGQNMVQDAPLTGRTGRLDVGDKLEVLEIADTPTPIYH
ncbi:MOSC domain-containing protein [Deinococcus psychrotolerans]|nr:MOSC N-terminal beta barrel domain-containing protein [Deinococcus psychrotolerans]